MKIMVPGNSATKYYKAKDTGGMMKLDWKARHHGYGGHVLESRTISCCSQLGLDESFFIPIFKFNALHL